MCLLQTIALKKKYYLLDEPACNNRTKENGASNNISINVLYITDSTVYVQRHLRIDMQAQNLTRSAKLDNPFLKKDKSLALMSLEKSLKSMAASLVKSQENTGRTKWKRTGGSLNCKPKAQSAHTFPFSSPQSLAKLFAFFAYQHLRNRLH